MEISACEPAGGCEVPGSPPWTQRGICRKSATWSMPLPAASHSQAHAGPWDTGTMLGLTMQIREALPRFGTKLSHELEHRTRFWLLVLSVFYFAATCLRASGRLFWYDELCTLYMCRLPDIRAIWAALEEAADSNPPLFYLVTRSVHALIGEGHVATRLPAIAGFWLMCLTVFYFVRRRSTVTAGFAALLFPLVTRAYEYATEARSYGMALGCAGGALLSYQSATGERRTKGALLTLALTLSAALLLHTYAVLLFIPLVTAELHRSLSRRRLDLPVWLAIAAASPVVILYVTLFAGLKPFLATTWAKPELTSVLYSYTFLLDPPFWPLLAAVILFSVHRPAGSAAPTPWRCFIPAHEVMAVFVFAALPVFGVLLAFAITKVYVYRYGLYAVIGASILIAVFVHSKTGPNNPRAVAPAMAFLLWFAVDFAWREAHQIHNTGLVRVDQSQPLQDRKSFLRAAGSPAPVVISDGRLAMELSHYSRPEVALRLYYLRDPAAALRYSASDVFERTYPILMKRFSLKLNVEEYPAFLARHREFLVYGPYGSGMDWVIFKLKDDGVHLKLLGLDRIKKQVYFLFRATVPGASGGSMNPKRIEVFR